MPAPRIYDIVREQRGITADTALRTQAYDLVMLDLGLPKRDGLAVLLGWATGALALLANLPKVEGLYERAAKPQERFGPPPPGNGAGR